MSTSINTLKQEAQEAIALNCEDMASRYGDRKEALALHADTLNSDRVELVFTVSEWHARQSSEDRKAYGKGSAIADAAVELGDVSPKTVQNAGKVVALATPENVLKQVEKLGWQAMLDTCTAIGTVKALAAASFLYDHLTNTKQECTKYWKRFATNRQSRGRAFSEIVEEFNLADADTLKTEFTKEADTVSRAVYQLALDEIKSLKAQLEVARADAVPESAPVPNGTPVASN